MAVPHQAQIRDKTYLNWVKAGLALKYTKEGIESFIDNEARELHKSLLNKLSQPPQNCGQCTDDNLLPHPQSSCHRRNTCICYKKTKSMRRYCPISVCGTLFDAIVSEHRFAGPSLKNSDISKWVTDHWEVAKNFLPNTGGYKDVKSATDTDLSGLVNIGINLKRIASRHKLLVNIDKDPVDFIKCRTSRNAILHNASQSLTDTELTEHLGVMKATLQCAAVLQNDASSKLAVEKLRKMETSSFEITDENITEVRQMTLKAIQDEGSKLEETIKKEGEKQRNSVKSTGVLTMKRTLKEGERQRKMIKIDAEVNRRVAVENIQEKGNQQVEAVNVAAAKQLENIQQAAINREDAKYQEDKNNTMHKRPFAEHNECSAAKRPREDVDNVPVLVKPETVQSLVKVFDQTENKVISIPVMDPPTRQPSQPALLIKPDTQREKQSMGSLLGAMDDPEIDLTDGPINVKVDLCTRPFYISHYKQAYAMRNIPRGKALILNVNEVVGKSPRRGTDIDRENLHNLLCQLHFDVTVYNDEDGLTAKEMVLKLQDFSQHADHKAGDCAVVCILSHGEEGYIFGADGRKFELDAVFELFNNTCCPNLRGKPKIFIIQACRGGALDRGVQYYADEHDGSDARVRQVPSMSDMVICYPTQTGYYAWRNRDRGSWYVEALVQVVMKYAKCEDLCTMLNRVNLLVSKKVSHCPNLDMDQMSQMSEYKSTLRMPHLYFFPGIGGC